MSKYVRLFEGKSAADKQQHFVNLREAATNTVNKTLKPSKFDASAPQLDLTKESLADIARGTLGRAHLESLADHNGDCSAWMKHLEAVDPVNASLFTNISQLLVLQSSVESYKSPEFIADQLMTVFSSGEDNVRIPGIQPIDADAAVIQDGEEYPDVKMAEDYIDTPRSVKRGAKIGITKDALFFDRTGNLVEKAQAVGYLVGKNRELRSLATILGAGAAYNTFSRKGTTRNTYVASADPRINELAANPLTNNLSFNTAWAAFNAMRDDKVNIAAEPIVVNPDTLLIPQDLVFSAARIVNPGQNGMYRQVDNTTQATYSGNPLELAGLKPTKILTSPWIKFLLSSALYGNDAANAAGYWYWGDFKKAFGYREVYPYEMLAAPAGNMDDWERDVVLGFKARERGVPYIKAPWNVLRNKPV